jgi:uncharacterized protein YceK
MGARFILLSVCLALSGCGSLLTQGTSDVAGVVGAGAASAVTRNAALATGIGLGVQAGAQAGLQYVERKVHKVEQDAIAHAAGPLAVGQVGDWAVTHTLPVEADEHGEVTVTRVLGGGAFACKDVIFSVDEEKGKRSLYVTSVCRDQGAWRWAMSDPATERWGALQ